MDIFLPKRYFENSNVKIKKTFTSQRSQQSNFKKKDFLYIYLDFESNFYLISRFQNITLLILIF